MERKYRCNKNTRYTREIHANRLLRMLEIKRCGGCPAAANFDGNTTPTGPWKKVDESSYHYPCAVCMRFVGIKPRLETLWLDKDCPCHYYGQKKALEITRKRLGKYFSEKGGKK